MNSGNLQVKRSPESIPRKFGNFLAGLSGKVLILSALTIAWTFGGANSVAAQSCGFAVPADPANTTVTYNVELDPGDSCAVFTQASVAGDINPEGSGCNIYFSTTSSPALGDTLYSEFPICCDGSGLVGSGDTFYAFSDTSNNYSAEGSAVGVGVIVNLNDVTDPTITDTLNTTPMDGENLALDADSMYVYSGDTLAVTGANSVGCAANLGWNNPEFSDNCMLDSLIVSFTGDATDTPDSLPDGFTISGNGAILAQNGLPQAEDFYSSSATGTGITTVTYRLVDEQGNETIYSFTVTVSDVEDPEFDRDGTVWNEFTTDSTCTFIIDDMDNSYDPGADDNCAVVSLTHDYLSAPHDSTLAGAEFPLDTTIVTWTAEDAAGNSVSLADTFIVVDDVDPFFTFCPTDTTLGTSEDGLGNYDCFYTAATEFDALADDNCAIETVYHDSDLVSDSTSLDGARFGLGDHTVVWTAEDESGNTATCSFTITVVDDEDPMINDCPSNMTVFTDNSSCDKIASWSPPIEYMDNCALAAFDVEGFTADGDPMNIFNTPTGNCNNTVGFTGAFSPDLWDTSYTASSGFDPFWNAQLFQVLYGFESGDNFSISVQVPSDYSGLLSFNLFYDILPSSADSGSNTMIIDVDGNFADTFTVSSSSGVITTETEFVSVSVTPGSVVTISSELFFSGGLEQGDAIVSINSLNFICATSQSNAEVSLGDNLVRYTLEDNAGNMDTCEFTITLEDNDAPVANAQDVTVSVGSGNPTVNVPASDFDVSSTDNCAIDTMYLSWNPTGTFITVDCDDVGDTIDIDFIVCDAAMNCDTAQVQLVVVENAIPVTAFCPADQVTVNDPGVCTAEVNYPTPRAHDGCSADTNMVFQSGFVSGSDFPVGVTPVTWYHVGKISGDTIYCQFNVVVEDDEAPVIADCPADIVESADLGLCSATIDWVEPTATDNCTDSADIIIVQNHFPGNTFDVGTTTVQYTFTDDAGNLAQCVFDITVEDNEDPIVGCEPFTRDLDECGQAYVHFTDILNFVDDDCGIATHELIYKGDTFLNEVTLICSDLGTNQIDLLVTDANGNTAQCNTTVTVFDDIAPEVECHLDITVNISDYDPTLCEVTGIPGIGFDYIGCSNYPPSAGEYYSNDSCNVTTSYTIEDAFGGVINGGPFTGPVSFDPGSEVFQLGDNEVTVIVTDANGLADTCSFTVTVVDDVNPTITCAADDTRGTSEDGVEGDCMYVVQGDEFDPTAFDDNCSVESVVHDLAGAPSTTTLDGAELEAGTHTVIWTVTDGSGNTATCSVTITVEDDEDPQITCADNAYRTTSQDGVTGDCFYIGQGDEFDPVFTFDNCEIESVTHDFGTAPTNTTLAGAEFPGFCETTVVTWTIVDTAGNSTTCEIEITVEDDEDPEFLDPELASTGETCGDTIRLPNLSDNCHAELIWFRPELSDTDDNCSDPADMTMTEEIDNASVQAAVDQNYPFDGTDPQSMELSPEVDFPVGVTTITYTVFDQVCADSIPNSATCILTVIIEDTQEPAVTCPSPQTIYSICADSEVPDYRGSTQIDDNCETYTVTQDPAPGTRLDDVPGLDLEDEATFTVTITVTQPSYNNDFDIYSVDCNFEVTLKDEDVWTPTAGLPGGQLPQVIEISCAAAPVVIDAPTATKPDPDDCANGILTTEAVLTPSPMAGVTDNGDGTYSFETGSYFVTWVYDGGPLNQFQSITIITDPIPPVADCEDITVALDANGDASIVATDVDGGSTDNCGIDSYAVDIDEFSCADLGDNAVELTVTDLDGNTDACMAVVTVEDNMDPIALCEAEVTVSLDANGQGSIAVGDVDAGSSDNCDIVSSDLSQTEFDCGDLPISSPITVEENFVMTAIVGSYADNPSYNFTAPEFNGTVDVELDMEAIPTGSAWANNLRLRITDNNGNVIHDGDPGFPSGGGAQSATLELNDVPNPEGDWLFEVRNNWSSGTITTNFNLSISGMSVGAPTSVTLTVTDQSGNSDACQTSVNVVDNIAPVADCQDVTVQLDENGVASLGGDVISDSYCYGDNDNTVFTYSGNAPMTLAFSAGGIESCCDDIIVYDGPNGTGSVIYSGSNGGDLSGLSFTSTGNSISFQVDSDGSVSCLSGSGCCSTEWSWTVSEEISGSVLDGGSTDNCQIVSMTESQSAFTCAHVGDNDVTLTVTDQSGNDSECDAVVTVEDNVAPDFTCPADVVTCIGEQTISAAPATDACGITSAVWDATGATVLSGGGYTIDEKFNPGVTTVTYTITDVNDNVTECNFTVNVTDAIPPVPVCVDKVNVPLGPDGEVTLPASIVDLGSFDLGCDPAEPLTFMFDINNQDSLVSSYTFDCHYLGDNDVELVVMDAAWNSASCNTLITIQDNTPPVANCTEDVIEIYVNNGDVTVTADTINDGSTDNTDDCFSLTLEAQNNVFNLNDVGTQTVILLVTDNAGNFSTCSATVEVLSGVPTAVCIADPITIELDSDGLASIDPSDIDAGSFDPEGEDLTMTVDPSLFDCADAGMNVVVTLTVTDPHGNSDECTGVVIVEDNLPPVAICGDVTVELDADGEASITADDIDNGSFDNCGLASVTVDPLDESWTCGEVGDNDVVLTVTDNNGNESTCTGVVTVEDNISPTFVCDDELTLVLNNNGVGTLVPADVLETSVSDNCGIDEMVLNQSEFDCNDLGYNEGTLTITDVNGNSSVCEFTLNVTAPTGVCPEITIIVNNVEGSEGDVVCIPVTVENFTDVAGVQLTIEILDETVADVLGVVEGDLDDIGSNVIGNSVIVSWFVASQDAVTLPDGSTIFCIEVELVGEVDDMTGSNITDSEITQGLNVVPITTMNGSIEITSVAETAPISGNISTEYGAGIEDVDVVVSGDVSEVWPTDANGDYDGEVLLNSDVTLTPEKNTGFAEGITTMDLILIQMHLLLLDELDSPYKLIAADVSNDGTISTFDLVILQALIIGNITEFPNNSSWRFVDADYTFTDPTDPFADSYPEYIELTDVTSAEIDNDFVAVKIGDVNETVNALPGAQSRANFYFQTEDASYSAGERVEISFTANDFANMSGYQMTLDYDDRTLEFVGFDNPGNLENLSDANVNNIESGKINLNWYNAVGNTLTDGEELFTLVFHANSNVEAISQHIGIATEGLYPEAYTVGKEAKDLNLEFFNTTVDANEFVLYQNVPNPFTGQTIIGFELPKSSTATMEVIDETGKLIRSITREYPAGYNEIQIGIDELGGSGVYFYRLVTAEHSAVKSMILVD